MAGFETVIKLTSSDKERIKHVAGFFFCSGWFIKGQRDPRMEIVVIEQMSWFLIEQILFQNVDNNFISLTCDIFITAI